MKKFWIYLNPDTFIWGRGNEGLVYNSLNGKSYFYRNEEELKIWTAEFSDIKNLYCIEKKEEELTDKTHAWISKIMEIEAGGIMETSLSPQDKPIHLFPVLNLQGDVVRMKEKKVNSSYSLLNYLHEITVHINGIQKNPYYRQLCYPCPSDHTLDKEALKSLCNQLQGLFIPRLNLCGKNIMVYLENNPLESLKKIFTQITVHVLAHEVSPFTISSLVAHDHAYKYRIICREKDLKNLKQDFILPLCQHKQIEFCFLIESEEEGIEIEEFISVFHPEKYIVKPVYNGSNLSFFKENVFLQKEDLETFHLKKREIFAHQALNEHFFGKLIITPEGEIYSDFNRPPLGTVNDSLHDLIEKELTETISWRRIRENEVCKECVYQWLCPSPSHYESVLKRPNLCDLKSHCEE